MKIGILQTGKVPEQLASSHGEYPAMFQHLLGPYGFSFETWAVVDGVLPHSPNDADGWLITGSRHGAYEDHPWIKPLETFITDVFTAEVPLVGVCFGHQIVAQALGGTVEKFGGGWSVGPTRYSVAGADMTIHAWHQDQVTVKPDSADVVGHSPFCRHAALLYPGKAYTVQPHPEIRDGYAQGLLDLRAPGLVPQDRIDTARAALGTALDSDTMAAQFATFFRTRALT